MLALRGSIRRMVKMPTKKDTESYLELYDVAKKEKVAKAPLA